MHLTHIKFKPTKRHKLNFHPKELDDTKMSKESKDFAEKIISSKKTVDQFDQDLIIMFENEVIYGFDLYNGKDKIIIPEINPVTIFYSNAIMSYRNLILKKDSLLNESPTLNNFNIPIDPNKFGHFFQLASNCIINLQSALESFANRSIPEDYEFKNKDGKKFKPSLGHKLNKTVPELNQNYFKRVYPKENNIIRRLIGLRNEIIHLKPAEEKTNTKYKEVYRRLIGFEFLGAIRAVKKFINFYESNLIEECTCGKEYFYDFSIVDKG
ncbi:conserved protein of unknown function [Tenacibaculum sp. 190130A14a]|uniref:Apea-like HEPN domain-containing protein n=1 Tax=Tenacibaculum polynesiense TaxID=3137857 RepID=A0ABM9P7X4_9FLAO